MRTASARWWQANRSLVLVTVGAAVLLGVAVGLWAGLRAGVLVTGGAVAFMGVLALSSATMVGSEQILDRQIAMRERQAARPRSTDPES